MKTKLYFSIILIGLFFSVCEKGVAQAPAWQWAHNGSGTSINLGVGVAVDANGNSYVTGRFESASITFDTITLTNAGSIDIFIVKYDASGNVLWAKSAGGTWLDQVFSITADASGNSYITGMFADTLTFDSITLISLGGDIFVAKFDPSGNVQWAKRAGATTGNIFATDMAYDAIGNLYVTGYFSSPTFTAGSITIGNMSFANKYDIFVIKYDSSGNEVWAKNAGYLDDDIPHSIAVDADGNSYITGYFKSSTFTFGSSTLLNYGNNDVFLIKYDSAGNALWAKSAAGTDNDYGIDIALDVNGNSYVTGQYQSPTLTFGSTTLTNVSSTITLADMFVAKYTSSGNLIWTKNAGGMYNDVGTSISLDTNANAYVTGFFDSPTITFGNTTLTNAASTTNDIFVAKYDSSGNPLWAKSAGGNNSDCGAGIAVSTNGNVYLTGYFSDSLITFGNTTLINGSTENMFIAKLIPVCSTSSTINTTVCNSYSSPSGNYNWTSSGTYMDTIPNAAGCDSVITINLTINPLPVALYTLYPDTTTPHNWFALNQCIGVPPLNYVWNWGDSSAVSTGATPSHTYADSGYYNICVTVTDGNGCVNTYCDSSTYIYKGNSNSMVTLNVVMSLPNGIEDIDGSSSINISPNPVNDVLNVTHNRPLPANIIITISDMQGRVVGEKNTNHTQVGNSGVIPIDVSALSRGLYLLRMDGVVLRFVKL